MLSHWQHCHWHWHWQWHDDSDDSESVYYFKLSQPETRRNFKLNFMMSPLA
jgi:hypothetical protein